MISAVSSLINIGNQVLKFDYISIAFIIIMIITFIVMFIKGFLNSLVSLISVFGSIALALLVTSWLVVPISEGLFGGMKASIYEGIASNGELYTTLITPENQEEAISMALTELGYPSFLAGFLNDYLGVRVPEEGIVIAELFSSAITELVAGLIIFIIMWIGFFLVFSLLKKLTKQFNEIPIIGFINRLLGGVIGLAFSYCLCVVISFAIGLIMTIDPSINTFFSDLMYLNDESVWTFSKAIFEFNLIGKIFG